MFACYPPKKEDQLLSNAHLMVVPAIGLGALVPRTLNVPLISTVETFRVLLPNQTVGTLALLPFLIFRVKVLTHKMCAGLLQCQALYSLLNFLQLLFFLFAQVLLIAEP